MLSCMLFLSYISLCVALDVNACVGIYRFLLEKLNQRKKLAPVASKKSTAASATDSTVDAKDVFKASGSMSFTTTAPVVLSPAPPPLIPVSSLAATATSCGGRQEDLDLPPSTGSAVPTSGKSCLSSLLMSQAGNKEGTVQDVGGQDNKGVSIANPGGESTVKSVKPLASGQSSSVSSSSESECEAEDAPPALGAGDAETKTKGECALVCNVYLSGRVACIYNVGLEARQMVCSQALQSVFQRKMPDYFNMYMYLC